MSQPMPIILFGQGSAPPTPAPRAGAMSEDRPEAGQFEPLETLTVSVGLR